MRDIFRGLEASTDDEGVEWITIIKEGVSANNRKYSRPTLQKAVEERVYEDMKMFVDHSDGPPLKRSIKELVSGINQVKLDTTFDDGKARVRGALEWFNEDFHKFADKAKKHIGVSHDAQLRGKRSIKEGRRFEDISHIPKVHSVDWVVYPSAGGGFEHSFQVQEGVEVEDAIDWDAIDEDMLKEKSPELYKALTARSKEAVKPNGKSKKADDDDEEDEDDSEDGQESVKLPKNFSKLIESTVETAVNRAVESVQEKQTEKAEVHKQVTALVNKSTLPTLTKERVIKSFDGSESFEEDNVKEAIEDAKKEVAAIAGPRVRGMGPSGKVGSGKTSVGRAHEAIERVFGMGNTKKKDDDADEGKEKE